jgi:hypothetical protein
MQTQDNNQKRMTQAPSIEIEYLPSETDFTGSTVLVFGRQRRTDLINQLVSGQSVNYITELVDALLKFITQPVIVLDNILTKHNMRRNGSALMELVNSRTVYIGKSDVTGFPDNVMAQVSYVFIDNTYKRDERKFMYEHYLKAVIPSLDKFNLLLNSLESSEFLVIHIKGNIEAHCVYVYDIDRAAKLSASSQAVAAAAEAVPVITVTNDDVTESEYVIPRNESLAQLVETPAPTADPVPTQPVGVPTQVPEPKPQQQQQGWLSYLTSFIW